MWHKSHVFSAKKCLVAAVSAVACVAMIVPTVGSANALVSVYNNSVSNVNTDWQIQDESVASYILGAIRDYRRQSYESGNVLMNGMPLAD